ncbi:MAG TPA: GlsB/YeaQ/YmgE family stress response membrane protein [Novosphingobium sp.]|nr:GlsB/YeaQ/YmgE family stress response membrane protein [Novosphingobium sp.]
MLNIISALVSGLFVGALARWFYPGAVQMGWLMTILLGIGGSLLAGLITASRTGGIGGAYSRPGCLASVLGAMALIFLGRALAAG